MLCMVVAQLLLNLQISVANFNTGMPEKASEVRILPHPKFKKVPSANKSYAFCCLCPAWTLGTSRFYKPSCNNKLYSSFAQKLIIKRRIKTFLIVAAVIKTVHATFVAYGFVIHNFSRFIYDRLYVLCLLKQSNQPYEKLPLFLLDLLFLICY